MAYKKGKIAKNQHRKNSVAGHSYPEISGAAIHGVSNLVIGETDACHRARMRRLACKPGEKSGLTSRVKTKWSWDSTTMTSLLEKKRIPEGGLARNHGQAEVAQNGCHRLPVRCRLSAIISRSILKEIEHMAKATPSRTKRSKPEVEKEFNKIVDEVSEQKESANTKIEELSRLRDTEIRQAVEDISVEGVVQKLSGLSLEISKALADLSGKLVAEVEKLTSIREAVALESKELERLHKIDIAATAIDQLVQDYQSQKQQFEAEVSAQRETWAAEELERAREQKEYEDNLKRQRQREVEDYEYKKSLERKKAQDKYDEDQRLLEKKNKEKQEELQKSWMQRELALKEKEEEWARLQKEVADFPGRLKKETDLAVGNAVKSAEQRFEQQVVLLRKDSESEKRLGELQIKSLQDTAARQSAEIEKLQALLEEAKRQVQDIAVKAIEGASGAQALSQINKIAMEQAKTRAPQS
jgi:colicin import membrane protein